MKWDVTCVILAGGESRRMGRDKTSLQLGGIRLFDYVYSTCSRIFSEIIIVTNKHQQFSGYQARVVPDEIPGTGSLGGLYTGLLLANHYYTFYVACDMPFIQPELISHLIKKRFNYDVVVPVTRKGMEPLHALYSKRCIEPIKKHLAKGELKITAFFTEVRAMYCEEEEIKRIDPSLTSFINVNAKKDLLKIQEVLRGYKWEEKVKAC